MLQKGAIIAVRKQVEGLVLDPKHRHYMST